MLNMDTSDVGTESWEYVHAIISCMSIYDMFDVLSFPADIKRACSLVIPQVTPEIASFNELT